MLEKYLTVGSYINLNLINPRVDPYKGGQFVLVPVQNCYLQEATGIFTKTAQVQPGVGPKPPRNFKYLPWLGGAISEMALVDMDVLTGPMSGCWLTTYKKANGVPHAGHVGTVDSPEDQKSIDAKKGWNDFAAANPASIIGGFNPLRDWKGSLPMKQGNEPPQTPKIWGLFTTNNEFYTIILFLQPNAQSLYRIAGLQKVTSSLPNKI